MQWLNAEMIEMLRTPWTKEKFDNAPLVRIRYADGRLFGLLNVVHGESDRVVYGLFEGKGGPYLGDFYYSQAREYGFTPLEYEFIQNLTDFPLSVYAYAAITKGELTERRRDLESAARYLQQNERLRSDYQQKPFSVWCCQPYEMFSCVSALGSSEKRGLSNAIGFATEKSDWLSSHGSLRPYVMWAREGIGHEPGIERESPIEIPNVMTGPERAGVVMLDIRAGRVENVAVVEGACHIVVRDFDRTASTAPVSTYVTGDMEASDHIRKEWRLSAD